MGTQFLTKDRLRQGFPTIFPVLTCLIACVNIRLFLGVHMHQHLPMWLPLVGDVVQIVLCWLCAYWVVRCGFKQEQHIAWGAVLVTSGVICWTMKYTTLFHLSFHATWVQGVLLVLSVVAYAGVWWVFPQSKRSSWKKLLPISLMLIMASSCLLLNHMMGSSDYLSLYKLYALIVAMTLMLYIYTFRKGKGLVKSKDYYPMKSADFPWVVLPVYLWMSAVLSFSQMMSWQPLPQWMLMSSNLLIVLGIMLIGGYNNEHGAVVKAKGQVGDSMDASTEGTRRGAYNPKTSTQHTQQDDRAIEGGCAGTASTESSPNDPHSIAHHRQIRWTTGPSNRSRSVSPHLGSPNGQMIQSTRSRTRTRSNSREWDQFVALDQSVHSIASVTSREKTSPELGKSTSSEVSPPTRKHPLVGSRNLSDAIFPLMLLLMPTTAIRYLLHHQRQWALSSSLAVFFLLLPCVWLSIFKASGHERNGEELLSHDYPLLIGGGVYAVTMASLNMWRPMDQVLCWLTPVLSFVILYVTKLDKESDHHEANRAALHT